MAPEDRTAFHERLFVPWWSWPVGLVLAGFLAMQISMGGAGARTWVPAIVLPAVAVAILVWLGRLKITVTADDFSVDDATLPRRFIAETEVLSGTPLRDALSAGLHPLAFVIQRPWVRSAVRVWLNDPDDPTPYWIISTRRPEQLCQALAAAPDTSDAIGVEPEPAPHR